MLLLQQQQQGKQQNREASETDKTNIQYVYYIFDKKIQILKKILFR